MSFLLASMMLIGPDHLLPDHGAGGTIPAWLAEHDGS
jgi:hypothetical protein